MEAKMERAWALAKAELLEAQIAYLTIILDRHKTYEALTASLQMHVNIMKDLVREQREAAKMFGAEDPGNN